MKGITAKKNDASAFALTQHPQALLPSPFVAGSPQRGFDVVRLPSVGDALTIFFDRVALPVPRVENVALEDAAGRVLAHDVTARDDIPSHARSTMDGYAVSSAAGTSPRRLVGEVAMGRSAASLRVDGTDAVRVPTGGAIPAGADTVVPQEDCDLEGGAIVPREAPVAGDNVADRGGDIRAGTLVLRAGRRLGAPELGVLATLGVVPVPVFARPRIAIVSTGDELIDPAVALSEGCVRDSNRYAIGAALAALGAEPVHMPRSADRHADVRAAFVRALASCDAIVSSGGSSVGTGDLVPAVVAELGAPGAVVHGIRVKPGKPTLLGAIGPKPVIGLPGNPTSSLMILEAVVRPIVQALAGETRRAGPVVTAIADGTFSGRAGWTWYVPAIVFTREGALYAEPLRMRSSQTSLLARASGYVTLDETTPRRETGNLLEVALFSSGGAPIEHRLKDRS